MFIDQQVAQKIVDRAMKVIGCNVNVMNQQGFIIGSGDPERINQQHQGALEVLQLGQAIDIDQPQAGHLQGVKQGINLPIICNGEIVGVVGITGEPEQVSKYADLVVMTAELIVEQAALTAQVQWDKRQREAVILRLIEGNWQGDFLFDERVDRLGIELDLPRVVVVLQLVSDSQQDLSLATMQQVLRLLESGHQQDLLAISSPSQIVILRPLTGKRSHWQQLEMLRQLQDVHMQLVNQPEMKVAMAVGRPAEGAADLAASYHSALQVLAVTSIEDQGFYNAAGLALEILLNEAGSSWPAAQLRSEIDRLVAQDRNGALLKTLAGYFDANADFGIAAQHLHIHRNTLRYRLDKIADITGLNIDRKSTRLNSSH